MRDELYVQNRDTLWYMLFGLLFNQRNRTAPIAPAPIIASVLLALQVISSYIDYSEALNELFPPRLRGVCQPLATKAEEGQLRKKVFLTAAIRV